jgi:hypothetical protein
MSIVFLIISLFPALKAEGYPHSEKTLTRAAKFTDKIWKDREVGLQAVVSDHSSANYSLHDSFFRLSDDSSLLGYLVVSAAKGRFDHFEFMMVYTNDFEVVEIRILVYRSEYGSQVASRGWLKQFYGFPPEKPYIYGYDVDALSGATFSAKSLTVQVNRINRMVVELAGE